jgi:membrane peptidoglycan carboxypeptidase
MRNRILARMLENAAITQADYAAAQSAPLDLAPPPEDRAPCRP